MTLKNTVYSVASIAVFLCFQLVSSIPAQAGKLEQACETATEPPPPAGADIGVGFTPSKHELEMLEILNQRPPKHISYIGTTGYLTQEMKAIPDAPTCPLGGAVILSRPFPDADWEYNRDCCPPGLKFASPTSVEIVGTPTEPGVFEKTILLCGYCEGARSFRFPIQATIKWVIKGKKPQRLD